MACACTGCMNKRNYYLWLLETVSECGTEVPLKLKFDPWTSSNTRLDSAISRLIKLYRQSAWLRFNYSQLDFDFNNTPKGK